MNVCGRMEQTSKAGRIQCSFETAELLRKSGKEAWLEKRSEGVMAKGKHMLWRNLVVFEYDTCQCSSYHFHALA